MITSDHGGFTGVGASANELAPAKAFSSAGVSSSIKGTLIGAGALGTPLGVLAFMANTRKTAPFFYRALLQR